MLYKLGRAMQLVGLGVLPVAIAGEVAGQLALKPSLVLSAAGVLIFFIGWQIQQATRPR